ncbi:MAG TPA: alpha/beta hydrolase [Jiangellaceae bacterium]|nr:alpha/beta hydrolase [Jiangellaceae bacterium]
MTQKGRRQAYPIEHGPRTGESIVLLHGGNVAGWMWDPQVERMPGRHLLTPNLPGYGARTDEPWTGMDGTADDIADLIRSRGIGGKAHLVGLSLGGIVSIHLMHRHPELVHTCIATGSAITGYSRLEQLLIGAQVPLWRRRWYWAAQAFAFGIPKDSREQYASDASRVSAQTNRDMFRQVVKGSLPEEFDFAGPVLAVSGEHDTRSVTRAFEPLRAVLPQLRTWIAPRMHHAWNIEDPDLFTRMITTHAETGTWTGPAGTEP